MKKDKFNSLFREYAKTLSPTKDEKDLVVSIYGSINDLLWVNNCIQIGSYPRRTSITPIHDLDILYFLWAWSEDSHNPLTALQYLYGKIKSDYQNPTKYDVKVSPQTHSITLSFQEDNKEILWVDIVPAYTYGTNEFWDDTYKVPEIVNELQRTRFKKYETLKSEHKDMEWILSDPRWYIRIAADLNEETKDFRKATKMVKGWKNNLCSIDGNLKFKSFHLEQIITHFFQDNSNLEIFDAIFNFFIELPTIIDSPNQIADRANPDKFIDDYIEKFTQTQKERIIRARNWFLIKLENLTESDSIKDLFDVNFHKRNGHDEQFLFDFNIPVFIDDSLSFQIDGLLKRKDWFREYTYRISQWKWKVDNKNSIKFIIPNNNTGGSTYLWKVKNDNNCGQPRWEITKGNTRNSPESTAYWGRHYVECYSILNEKCIAKSFQEVII